MSSCHEVKKVDALHAVLPTTTVSLFYTKLQCGEKCAISKTLEKNRDVSMNPQISDKMTVDTVLDSMFEGRLL